VEESAVRIALRLPLCLACCAGLALAAPAALWASCGSTSCPIETRALNLLEPREWTLDLSFQYIDQDRPRIGTRSAAVGEIASEHDEVRTVNRTAIATLRYAPSQRFQVGLTFPWVSRFHEHVEPAVPGAGGEEGKHGGSHGEAGPERWSLQGAGDLALEAQARVWSRGRTSLWATGAVELPTGAADLDNGEGEVAEPPLQPGSDSTDWTAGLSLRGSAVRDTALSGPLGHATAIPWFATLTYRRNGDGRQGYRLGEEWQANAGGAYPLARGLDLLFQLNARRRGEDAAGETGEDVRFTGGTFLFASPGLRVGLGGRWAEYAFVQIPVYQDVHLLQLTARANWLTGVQARF
jgi:hypothetical protein